MFNVFLDFLGVLVENFLGKELNWNSMILVLQFEFLKLFERSAYAERDLLEPTWTFFIQG